MFKFLFLLVLSILILGCTPKVPIIVISFDLEFPVGIGFPENFSESQKLENTPNEIDWQKTVNRINEIGIKNNVKFQFNVVGLTAEDSPALVQNLSKTNDISCHSYSHKNLAELPQEKAFTELKRCKETLERITGIKIKGNRFPYTNYTEDLMKELKKLDYKWDSSDWENRDMLIPSFRAGLTEYPLAPIPDDWTFFIRDQNKDASSYFSLIEEDIAKTPVDSVYVLVLHPWVLTSDPLRVDALENFVSKHKNNIKSIDQIYER